MRWRRKPLVGSGCRLSGHLGSAGESAGAWRHRFLALSSGAFHGCVWSSGIVVLIANSVSLPLIAGLLILEDAGLRIEARLLSAGQARRKKALLIPCLGSDNGPSRKQFLSPELNSYSPAKGAWSVITGQQSRAPVAERGNSRSRLHEEGSYGLFRFPH